MVKFYSSFVTKAHTAHTHSHTPGLKGSSRETQQCLCQGQISHVSLLQHTDRSSQYRPLYEGQVHAHLQGGTEGGRKGGKVEKCIFPFSPHFLLASCLHLSFSPHALLLSSPSLHRGIQCLYWERSSLKVIQNCSLLAASPLFPTYRPTLLATPSTLHPQSPPLSPQGA